MKKPPEKKNFYTLTYESSVTQALLTLNKFSIIRNSNSNYFITAYSTSNAQ